MEDSKVNIIELVKNSKDGNQIAFSKLIDNIKNKLYKTAIAILKNDDDACDAIQETLLKAYQNIGTLKNNDYFTTWIIRILVNNCYDIIRKNKKIVYINEKIVSSQDTYYELYCQESSLEYVLNMIDKDLKLVTILYYYDGLSINNISEILNIPEGTVKSRLSRAREKIYSILKKEEGEKLG